MTARSEGLVSQAEVQERSDLGGWIRSHPTESAMFGMLVLTVAVLVIALGWMVSSVRALQKLPVSTASSPAVSGQSVLPGLGSLATPVEEETSVPKSAEVINASSEIHPVKSGKFPGEVEGPAIVEWWNKVDKEGIFRLQAGETFAYGSEGTYWQFASDEALEARYSTHRAEYFNSHSNGVEGKPEN